MQLEKVCYKSYYNNQINKKWEIDSFAINFRRWATEHLKEYMIKGFAMDDERLKQFGGGNYWKELLDRISRHPFLGNHI